MKNIICLMEYDSADGTELSVINESILNTGILVFLKVLYSSISGRMILTNAGWCVFAMLHRFE